MRDKEQPSLTFVLHSHRLQAVKEAPGSSALVFHETRVAFDAGVNHRTLRSGILVPGSEQHALVVRRSLRVQQLMVLRSLGFYREGSRSEEGKSFATSWDEKKKTSGRERLGLTPDTAREHRALHTGSRDTASS